MGSKEISGFKYKKGDKAYAVLETGKVVKFTVASAHPSHNSVKAQGSKDFTHISKIGKTVQEALMRKMIEGLYSIQWRTSEIRKHVKRLEQSHKAMSKLETKLKRELAK